MCLKGLQNRSESPKGVYGVLKHCLTSPNIRVKSAKHGQDWPASFNSQGKNSRLHHLHGVFVLSP